MSEPMNAASATREGTIEDRTLIVERVFRAPPEQVFQAWTDPEILTKWWGPTGATIPECDLDATPGGAWRTVMPLPTATGSPCPAGSVNLRRPIGWS